MKYLEEFRDPKIARRLLSDIHRETTRPWVIMEVCGGQTHAILRHGLDQLLPQSIDLVHGPGCPVCVTPSRLIDTAIALAQQSDTIMTTFGDMLRVPGSASSLADLRSRACDLRVVYSPLNALTLAQRNPDKKVVFFAVGFETTAPATALALRNARQSGCDNFFVLCAHVLVEPAMAALLRMPGHRIQAYLAAGHVCTITGWEGYRDIVTEYGVPVVVTGFEPLDLLVGIRATVRQLESGRAKIENCYTRAVTEEGNTGARSDLREIFEIVDREWRGLGRIPRSGYALRDGFARFDARRLLETELPAIAEADPCISGDILRGARKPVDCPAFGRTCTPETPLGAPMVSSEGACAAYFRYRQGHGILPSGE